MWCSFLSHLLWTCLVLWTADVRCLVWTFEWDEQTVLTCSDVSDMTGLAIPPCLLSLITSSLFCSEGLSGCQLHVSFLFLTPPVGIQVPTFLFSCSPCCVQAPRKLRGHSIILREVFSLSLSLECFQAEILAFQFYPLVTGLYSDCERPLSSFKRPTRCLLRSTTFYCNNI